MVFITGFGTKLPSRLLVGLHSLASGEDRERILVLFVPSASKDMGPPLIALRAD